jgi:hypothetical protein
MLLVDVEIGNKLQLTTGARAGVKLDPESLKIAGADQLARSEFGMICLWSRKTEKIELLLQLVSPQ